VQRAAKSAQNTNEAPLDWSTDRPFAHIGLNTYHVASA
jgi:hypothetical protein